MFQFKASELEAQQKLEESSWRNYSGEGQQFYSSLQLIGLGPPTLHRVICFAPSIKMLISYKNTLVEISTIVTKYQGIPGPSEVDT